MARQIIERHNLVSAAALTAGGRTIFSKELPVGEGWHSLHIRVNYSLTHGTGTTPVVDGLYKAIRNVFLRTDRGEIIANAPGKFWWFQNLFRFGTAPRSTVLAASTAVYSANFVIPFVDHKTMRPNDTILNTARYSSMTLELNMGTIADLLGTPGTDTVAMTVDIDVVKTRGVLPKEAEPAYHISYDVRQPVDASVTTSIDLERSPDLSYKRLYLSTVTSGTAGLPFYGTFADSVINTLTLKDQTSNIFYNIPWTMLQADNAMRYGLDVGATESTPSYPIAMPAGFMGCDVISFIGEGESLASSLFSGDKSLLQVNWTNATAPANSIVTLGTEGIRYLK